ncbi:MULTISPECIES: DUF397 domain-containing protein [unclassified Streptomyces]|uniref:DUF397 domain-containing protein n=1 Tax=unclassified Streptomyces TaxID=2593676 RepID=UPI003D8A8852
MLDKSALTQQQVPSEAFYKSSYSGNGSGSECLEVAPLVGGVRVRDSKNPNGPVLNFFVADFEALVAAVKDGGPLAG